MSTKRHAIIAGVNKCGTTSVFRYLARHPEILASRIKETRFFVREDVPDDSRTYVNYLENFESERGEDRVLLEASPSYFTSGASAAQKIRQILPNVKLVVLLRDPVTRLASYYRSARVYDNYANAFVRNMDFPEFVSAALDAAKAGHSNSPREKEFIRAVGQGTYVRHLREFGGELRDEQIEYFFFENLVTDTRGVMKAVCQFLEIDADFFDDFEFSVENKSRAYRSSLLQKVGYQLNMRLEPFFNARPGLRRLAQTLYRRINEKSKAKDTDFDATSIEKLTEFYRRDSRQLGGILREMGELDRLPSWLGT